METNEDRKDNVEMLQIDKEQDGVQEEQEEVIAELEEVLHFLKTKQVKNKESLAIMKKPLGDLRSCLKYLPTDSYFDHLPNEITTNILSNLSDSNAVIAAAVCLKWKGFVRDRFTEKAVLFSVKVADLKMDVNMVICDSVKIVANQFVAQGPTSVSKFSLVCEMRDEECEVNPRWIDELQDLSRGLGELDDVTLRVEMKPNGLGLSEINQDRLVNYLVNKVDDLTFTLDGVKHTNLINFEKLINKLSQEPSEIKLKRLTLNRFEWPDELNIEVANALCNVENVSIYFYASPKKELFAKQLMETILTRPVKIISFRVGQDIDYRPLIDQDNLKKLFNKMTFLALRGFFTSEQDEAVRSLTGAGVEYGWGGVASFKKDALN